MQRTQISAYVTEEQRARLNILAAAEQLTSSGWVGNKIDNAFYELYGLDAKGLVMESVIKAASGKHSVRTADGKRRRTA